MFDVKALIEALEKHGGIAQQTGDGRNTIFLMRDGSMKTIPLAERAQPIRVVGDIDSFVSHVRVSLMPGATEISVGSGTVAAYYAPTDFSADVEVIHLPHFKDDLPPESRMMYDSFLLFLENNSAMMGRGFSGQIGNKVIDEESIFEACKMISFTDNKETKVHDDGASTSVTMTQSSKIEPITAQLPKLLKINLRVGSRCFSTECTFRLTVKSDLTFGLTRLKDLAVERFIDHAYERIKSELGDNWHVIKGI